jgi:hypothetical protein
MSSPNRAINLAVLAATAFAVAACSSRSDDYVPPPPPANTAPTISAIANQTADQDTVVSVDFTIQDAESGTNGLTVTATADATTLFPSDGVVLSGSGGMRKLTLTPLEATTGTATIAIRVADADGLVSIRNFQVAVNARNASLRMLTFDTFAKGDADPPTMINGLTVQQDVNDLAGFAPLIPPGDE